MKPEVVWVLILLAAMGIAYIFCSCQAFIARQRQERLQAALKKQGDPSAAAFITRELLLHVCTQLAKERGEKFDAEAVRKSWKERKESKQ